MFVIFVSGSWDLPRRSLALSVHFSYHQPCLSAQCQKGPLFLPGSLTAATLNPGLGSGWTWTCRETRETQGVWGGEGEPTKDFYQESGAAKCRTNADFGSFPSPTPPLDPEICSLGSTRPRCAASTARGPGAIRFAN